MCVEYEMFRLTNGIFETQNPEKNEEEYHEPNEQILYCYSVREAAKKEGMS